MSQRSTQKGFFWSNNPFYQWCISAQNGEHAQLQAWKMELFQPLNVALQAVAEAMAQAVFICDVEK